jgi:hypothetical protein
MWFYFWLQNTNFIIDWKTRVQLYLENFDYKTRLNVSPEVFDKITYSIVSVKRDTLRDKTRVTYVTLMVVP